MHIPDDGFLSEMVRTSPVGICIMDAATLIVESANEPYLEVACRTYEQMIGSYFWDIFPELKDGFEDELLKAAAGEIIRFEEIEIPLIRFGKLESIIITFDYRPVKNQAGEVTKIVVWVIEFTHEVKQRREIQRLNEELQASNEELQTSNEEVNLVNERLVDTHKSLEGEQDRLFQLIMQAPAGLALMRGPEFIFTIFNTEYQAILPKHNLTGRPFFEALPELIGTNVEEAIREVYATGNTRRFNDQLVPLPDFEGAPVRERYFNFSYHAWRDEPGNIAGIINFAYEVTEQVNSRKAAEKINAEQLQQQLKLEELNQQLAAANQEQAAANQELTAVNGELSLMRFEAEQAEHTLRVAIDAANIGTWHIDAGSRAIAANTRLKELFGFTADETPALADFMAQITEDYRTDVIEAIEQTITRAVNYDCTYTVRGKNDDVLRWVRAVGSMKPDISGELTAFTGVVLDITEQKADEARKDDFIGMVSHELKTPLTSMNGYIQMLQSRAKKNEDVFTAGVLEKANNQARKMTTMINGFLNVSRLESGKINIDRQRFDMALLMKETEEETVASISSHQIIFEPVEETLVNADRDKIGQVINNLISNAVKYSPPGSTIHVACVTQNGQAVVSVKDEGMGVSPEDLPMLFERYYRVRDAGTRNIAGFGIGLYLCHEIISRHGGEIKAESEPDKGSTFYFTLPVVS